MADFIPTDEVNSILEDLKNTIISNLSDTRLSKFYNDQVDGFIRFCRNKGTRAIIVRITSVAIMKRLPGQYLTSILVRFISEKKPERFY